MDSAPSQGRSALASRLGLFFAAIYFVQGIAEPGAGIAAQPIFFLLKDELHLSAAQTAAFLATISIAWGIKPVYGLISDFFPLFGYRRKSYLLLMTGLAAACWLALGSVPTYTYPLTLAVLLWCGFGLAFSDVLCDAVMVETGKPLGMTGRFQAIQWGAINTASVLAGVGGGWLSQHAPYQWTFRLVALFPLISLTTTVLCLRESRVRFDRQQVRETVRAVRSAVGSPPLWTAAAFIFLWNFSPQTKSSPPRDPGTVQHQHGPYSSGHPAFVSHNERPQRNTRHATRAPTQTTCCAQDIQRPLELR